MISEGLHIPKAVGVHSNHVLAMTLDVTGRSPWTWSSVVGVDWDDCRAWYAKKGVSLSGTGWM